MKWVIIKIGIELKHSIERCQDFLQMEDGRFQGAEKFPDPFGVVLRTGAPVLVVPDLVEVLRDNVDQKFTTDTEGIRECLHSPSSTSRDNDYQKIARTPKVVGEWISGFSITTNLYTKFAINILTLVGI